MAKLSSAGLSPADPRRPEGRVWRCTLTDGREVAVKLAARSDQPQATATAPDRLALEAQVLAQLRPRGAPVPELIAAEPGVLVTQWCAGATLDDWSQRLSAAARRVPVVAAGRGLLRLEAVFGQLPGAAAAVERRRPAWLAARRQEYRAAYEVAQRLAGQRPAPRLACRACDPSGLGTPSGQECTIADEWETLWAVVAASRLTLGPLDVNARNVLLSHEASSGDRRWRATFLDMGAVGPDSPARRLVHYTFALGAWQPAGRFVRGLTLAVAQRWARAAAAQWPGDPDMHMQQLDAYALLAELLLLGQVQAALAGRRPDLAAAWAAPAERLRAGGPDRAPTAGHAWAGAYDPPRARCERPAILCRVGNLILAEVR